MKHAPMTPTPQAIQYDPNIRWGRKHFKLRFSCRQYSADFEVAVGGNCHAMTNLDAAVGCVLDQLPTNEDDMPAITMTAPNGDILVIELDGADGEDWLMDMLVYAEVVRQEAAND